jgi:hypothetical protein
MDGRSKGVMQAVAPGLSLTSSACSLTLSLN